MRRPGPEINRCRCNCWRIPALTGKLSFWSRVVWRRVTLRNDWRSCLTKAGRYRWLPDACAKLRRAEYPPEVVTEGVLTRMIQRDPELSGVGLVILDEFHERSLQADLALALLLDVQQGLRDDLKLLIMSATLDNDRLQQMLPEAPVIISEGRSFPVERRYLPLPTHQRFDEAVAVATAEMLRQESGSLLLFYRRRRNSACAGTTGFAHRQ